MKECCKCICNYTAASRAWKTPEKDDNRASDAIIGTFLHFSSNNDLGKAENYLVHTPNGLV